MKLIQLNAWSGRLDYHIRKFLKDQAADIVCLQEAISLEKGQAGLFFLPLEELQESVELPYLAFGSSFSFNFMQRTASFGNAVLSRRPILKSDVIFVHREQTPNFDYTIQGSSNMRNFVHSVIKLGGIECNVLTHHGYWIPEHKHGNEKTLEQMHQIIEYIDGLEGPVILTGDFNLEPQSLSIKVINDKLRNLSVEHSLITTRTSLTNKREVCDYIFVNDSVKVKRFEASDEIVSDHKALVLEFEV